MPENNILLLRLQGFLQSWGERGRWNVRDSAVVPTKSGVMGLLAAALGKPEAMVTLTSQLAMGVLVNQRGSVLRDYHTVTTGTLSAKGKLRGGTEDTMTLVSTRYYLCGASFTVALMGAPELIDCLWAAVNDPVWPLYLGRKCCIPSAPIPVKTDWVAVGASPTLSLKRALGGVGQIELECPPYPQGIVRMDTIHSEAYRVFYPRYVKREGDWDNVPDKA